VGWPRQLTGDRLARADKRQGRVRACVVRSIGLSGALSWVWPRVSEESMMRAMVRPRWGRKGRKHG
jgi:hypothetical protein